MANPIVTTEELLAMLADAIAVGASAAGAKLNLFKNAVVPTPASVPVDFVKADFTGYTPDTVVVWGTPFVDSGGIAVVWSQAVDEVAATPITTSNTIYGWYLTNGAGTKVLAAELYDEPILIASSGRGVRVEVGLVAGPAA